MGALVHETGLVVVGERHGTNEFPALVLRLALAASALGRITLALELGDDARAPLASFVRSRGSSHDRDVLLSATSWQRRDGRASEAMFRLVEGIRNAVAAGADIDVEVFDAMPTGDPRTDSFRIEREVLMAARLREIVRRGPTLALSGNVHAELVARPGAPRDFVPAAALVAEHAELVSLRGSHAGGEAWCTQPIDDDLISGPHAVAGDDQGDQPFIELASPARVRSGVAYVGTITPSPPAVGADPPT